MMNTICIIANNKTYKGDKMKIKPCKCPYTNKIFCLVTLEDDETKRDILKREQEVRQSCLKLCENEHETDAVIDGPLAVIGKACGYFIVIFLGL